MTAQVLCAAGYVIGLGLTLINGWLAYTDTVATLQHLTRRVVTSGRYQQEGTAARPPAGGNGPKQRGLNSRDEATLEHDERISAHELAAHLVAVLRRNRVKLVLAATGLLLTGAMSVASLFVT